MDATWRRVARLAGPAILTSLLETAVFLADRVMLARYGQEALASMQLQGPLMWSIGAVFRALCIGVVALVAHSTGAMDLERRAAVIRSGLRLSSVVGVAVGGLCLATLPWIVVGLGPEDAHLRSLSSDYLSIGFAAIPAELVASTAAMIFAASGDTRTPFAVGLVTNAINIGVNAVLIFGYSGMGITVPELGVSGAAIGTATAFTVEAILLLVLLRRRGLWRATNPEIRPMPDLLRLGVPAMAERVVMQTGFLAFAKILTALGALAMATNQALITIESICFLCADGFGVAAAAVMGQALGAKDPAEAKRGGMVAVGMAVASLTVMGLMIWAGSSVLLPIFAPDPEQGPALVEAGIAVMPLLALAQPFMAAVIVVAQGLRGAGDTKSPLWSALVGSLVVRVSLAWLLGMHLGLGLAGVWIASLADWFVRTLLLGAVFLRGTWQR